jgi:hypothetical protein
LLILCKTLMDLTAIAAENDGENAADFRWRWSLSVHLTTGYQSPAILLTGKVVSLYPEENENAENAEAAERSTSCPRASAFQLLPVQPKRRFPMARVLKILHAPSNTRQDLMSSPPAPIVFWIKWSICSGFAWRPMRG